MVGAEWKNLAVSIPEIEVNAALQMRANEPPVEEYEELLRKNKGAWPFPPLRVIRCEGRMLLVEGFTRYRAALAAGRRQVVIEWKEGTWMDAVAEACGSNDSHGYRRTFADRRRAVRRAIEEGVEGPTAIAKLCRVSRSMVYDLITEAESPKKPAKAKAATAKPSKAAAPAVANSERDEPCPICASNSWVASDGGYVCSVCQYTLGEAAGVEAEEQDERLERRELIENGVARDLASVNSDYGRLVRSMKRAGLDAERPLLAINKIIQAAMAAAKGAQCSGSVN